MMIASCSPLGVAEAGDVACDNGIDEDDDGLVDCADPDCHAFDVCRDRIALPPAVAADEDDDEDDLGGGAWSWVDDDDEDDDVADDDDAVDDLNAQDDDAGVPDAPDTLDIPVEVTEDAEVPVCEPSCADDEFCNAGACETVGAATPGAFVLTVDGATIPINNAITQCYDTVCEGSFRLISFGICDCPANVYVRVLHGRNGVSTEVGRTAVAERSLDPIFGDSFDVDLEPGDVLIFEVYDDDTRTDILMYACSPDLTKLGSSGGTTGCTAPAGGIGERHSVSAALSPR